MARKKITADLNGGDVVTAAADLLFQVYDGITGTIITTANYSAIGSVNTPGTDAANITMTLDLAGGTGGNGQIILDGVEVGAAASLRIRAKDEAGNEGILSPASSAGYYLDMPNTALAQSISFAAMDLTAPNMAIEMDIMLYDNTGSQYILGENVGTKFLYNDNGSITLTDGIGVIRGALWTYDSLEGAHVRQTLRIENKNTTEINLYQAAAGVTPLNLVGFWDEIDSADVYRLGRFSTAEWQARLYSFKIIRSGVEEIFECNEGAGANVIGSLGTVIPITGYVDNSIWVAL